MLNTSYLNDKLLNLIVSRQGTDPDRAKVRLEKIQLQYEPSLYRETLIAILAKEVQTPGLLVHPLGFFVAALRRRR